MSGTKLIKILALNCFSNDNTTPHVVVVVVAPLIGGVMEKKMRGW